MVPFLSVVVTWLDSFPTHLVLHAPSVPVDRGGVIRIFVVSIHDDATEKKYRFQDLFPALGTKFTVRKQSYTEQRVLINP